MSLKDVAKTLALPNGFHLPFQVISSASLLSLGLIGGRVFRRNKPINAESVRAGAGHVRQPLITSPRTPVHPPGLGRVRSN